MSRDCVPCKGTKPLSTQEAKKALRFLPGWELKDVSIEKEFQFRSYLAGLGFAYAVGKLAEQQDHHPSMIVRWRRVKLSFSTHAIKGLSQTDLIMAAKTEK